MKDVKLNYCNRCQAFIFLYVEGGTQHYQNTIKYNKSGGVKIIKTKKHDIKLQKYQGCDVCFEYFDDPIPIPINLFKKMQATLGEDEYLFHIEFDNSVNPVPHKDMIEAIRAALKYN